MNVEYNLRAWGEGAYFRDVAQPTGEEGRFVRKGAVAGWREKFSESQLRLVDSVCGDVLARMGYPLAFPQEAARPELVGQSLAS